MSETTLSQLPQVYALDGTELMLISQAGTNPVPWVSYAITVGTLAGYIESGTSTSVTMRQLKAALSAQDAMVETFDALPADITNSYNIAWVSAARMSITDPFITGFLQPTLGYTDSQMAALFILAATFPA